MLTREVLQDIEYAAGTPNGVDKIDNFLIMNEPLFVQWVKAKAVAMTRIPNIAIAPQVEEILRNGMAASMYMGYLAAMIGLSLSTTKTGSIADYMLSMEKSPSTIYNDWIMGNMEEKYYGDEFLSPVSGMVTSDIETARKNYERRKTDDGTIIGRSALTKLLHAAGASSIITVENVGVEKGE